MNYDITSAQKNYQKTLSPEQLNQIVEAIADGRYSWACVLILRFVGYNPLHFIPQRTYSRLMKENLQAENTVLANHRRLTTNIPSNVNTANNRVVSRVINNCSSN